MPAAIQHALECVILDNPEICSNVGTLSHLIRRICFYKRIYIATNSAIRVSVYHNYINYARCNYKNNKLLDLRHCM